MAVTVKTIFNMTKYIKFIINNLMTLMKVFIYIINYLDFLSLRDIFKNIHKILLIINNIIKIIIAVCATVKFFYIMIIRLIGRLRNK